MTAPEAARTITLCLASHTNVGKTTLARTLLARDIGEVRDAAHVTEFAEGHTLIASPAGDTLALWDTPGFGDSVRLARRLEASANPIGWFLSQVWDRWRDRAFWSSQQALRNVREQADVVLYLGNAAESPYAPYVAPEMALLQWVGKPVLVLLNQLGAPREAALEAAEIERWTAGMRRWPRVHAVLPLDAFARCWVQESTLWSAVAAALPKAAQPAMRRLRAAWWLERRAIFDESMQALAAALAQAMQLRVPIDDDDGTLRSMWRTIGAALAALGASGGQPTPAVERAQARLADLLDAAMRAATAKLLALHELPGTASGAVIERTAAIVQVRQKVGEGRAAVTAGLVSGALGGLGADLAAGGLTLGGGMLAGALLGALGAAGMARGYNLIRDTESSWLAYSREAHGALLRLALLRYLAVAHFGRGRGDWSEGEAPAHWAAVVEGVLEAEAAEIARVAAAGADTLAVQLAPLLARCARRVLETLYPGCWESGSDNSAA